jgi:hypothetical protein
MQNSHKKTPKTPQKHLKIDAISSKTPQEFRKTPQNTSKTRQNTKKCESSPSEQFDQRSIKKCKIKHPKHLKNTSKSMKLPRKHLKKTPKTPQNTSKTPQKHQKTP